MNTCLLFMLVELIVSWEAVNPLKSSATLTAQCAVHPSTLKVALSS